MAHYTIEDMLQMKIYSTDEKGNAIPVVHTNTDKDYYIYELFRNVNISNLTKNKKCAFTQETLNQLHKDRNNGVSIRKLSVKYNKSTRTIQKYLKIFKI